MANFTQCAFSLPITVTTATQIKITLANSAVGAATKTATATPGTYFNNFDTAVSGSTTSLLGMLLHKLQAEESGSTNGVYAISEISNVSAPHYRGRLGFTRARGHAVDNVTSFEILGGEITAATLGSIVDPIPPATGTATAAVAFMPMDHRGAGHWVLHDLSLLANTEERIRVLQTSTTSPDGTTSRDVYGTTTRKRVDMLTNPGAATLKYYAADADHAAVIGCATGDNNAAFDELLRLWAAVDDSVYCRFYADILSIATFEQLQPGAEDAWLSSIGAAADLVSEGPVYFDIGIEAYKVS
jgi:hypothetical protein